MLVGMTGFGGSISTNIYTAPGIPAEYGAIVSAEGWETVGNGDDYDRGIAQAEAEASTNEIFFSPLDEYNRSGQGGSKSFTKQEYGYEAWPPNYWRFGTAVFRVRANYTIDLRNFGESNGYKKASFQLRWRYDLIAGKGFAITTKNTNTYPLALGQVTQLRCWFWPGWYMAPFPLIVNTYNYGYEWAPPVIILVKEEAEHGTTNSVESLAGDDKGGDPINLYNGNVSINETDLSLPTPGLPLTFARTYGSLSDKTNFLGNRWTHNYDWQITDTNTVFSGVSNHWLVLRQGVVSHWKALSTPTNSGATAQAIESGLNWKATQGGDGAWMVTFPGGMTANFNTNGRLARLSDGWSNSITLTFSNALPIQVSHSIGKSLSLQYESNRLSKITSPSTNFYCRYYYDGAGLLTGVVTYADGKTYPLKYYYEPTFQVITQRINAIGDIRGWEHVGQVGQRSWVGTNHWYETTVALSSNGSYRSYMTESRGDTNLTYAYDLNPIFRKTEQINGPIFNFSGQPIESVENGTNVLTLLFSSNQTNELEACWSNAVFRNLESQYGIYSAAVLQEHASSTRNEFDERGNKTLVETKEYSGSGVKQFSVTTMNYDGQNRLTNFGLGLGTAPANFWNIAWDTNNELPSSQTDPEGHEVSWVYTNGLVARESVQVSSGVSNTTVFVYTTNGLLSSVNNANNHALQMFYDNSGNATSIVFPENPTIEMTWTSLGYLGEIRLPSDSYDTNGLMVPRTTKFNTDSRGLVNFVTWPDGFSDCYYRDSIGQVTSWVDRVGRKTQYSYLPTKKLASVTRYLGSQAVTTRMDYDKLFNALKITDPLNRVVESYQLDNQSRPVRVSNINSQTMEISYVTGDRVDAIKRFDGTTVSNTYTGDGWVGAVKYPDENVTFGYFKNGLLKTASNPTGTIAITYNNAHQVLSVSNAVLKGLVSYSVDGLGEATSTVWNGIGITRDYSAGEQLNYVKVPTGEVFLSYNGLNGLLAGISNAAGLSAEYSYNSMDQVTGIAWRNASGDVIRSWAYTRNDVGFVTDVEKENGEISQYQYDGLDQLATAKQWNAAGELLSDERFAYDLAGNRTNKNSSGVSVDYSQGSGDWLTSWKVTTTDLVGSIDVYGVSSETIGTNNRYGSLYVSNDVAVTPDVDGTNFSVYMLPVNLGTQKVVCAIRDMAGNMGYATGTVFLSIVTNSLYSIDSAGCVTNIKYAGVQYSNNRGIKWDGQYRIKEVLTNGASCEKYGYDALGRRVITVSGGVTNFHVYDGLNVLADTDATGGVLRVYGHGAGIDHLLTMTVYTSGMAKTYYYLTDQLGSVHALADEVGNVVESYRFDAWGKVTGIYDPNGNHLSESAYGNRFLWQGREYSYRTELYYFRARWYDPVMGRWLSNDPIGISGGLNQYVFCGNNPVNFVDPYGLWAEEWAFWNPDSAVGRQFVSIGDAIGSTLARPFYPEGARTVWQEAVNNSGQSLLDESCAGKGARRAYWGAIGVSAAANAAAGWMIGTEALAANGSFNVANTILNRTASPFLRNDGSRWFSQAQAEALMNGPRLANTGQGVRNLLTTFRYANSGNGEVVLNWITRTVVHANPFY
jgi:RHS repeat-associated protein